MVIRYFDLGAYKGEKIDILLKVLPQFGEFEIYAIEPCKKTFKILKNKYRDFNNIYCYNIAINNRKGKCKLYHKNHKQVSKCNSIYETKRGVNKNLFEVVDCIRFSHWLKNYFFVHGIKDSFNILKYNIEGAELDLFRDMDENDLFKHFDVIFGSAGHDILKCKEIEDKIDEYYKICDKYDIPRYNKVEWKTEIIYERIQQTIDFKHGKKQCINQ